MSGGVARVCCQVEDRAICLLGRFFLWLLMGPPTIVVVVILHCISLVLFVLVR